MIEYKFNFEYIKPIKDISKKLKLKYKDVSIRAGLSHSYITSSIMTTSTRVPNFQCLYAICYVFNEERIKQGYAFDDFSDSIVLDIMKMIDNRGKNEKRVRKKIEGNEKDTRYM